MFHAVQIWDSPTTAVRMLENKQNKTHRFFLSSTILPKEEGPEGTMEKNNNNKKANKGTGTTAKNFNNDRQ